MRHLARLGFVVSFALLGAVHQGCTQDFDVFHSTGAGASTGSGGCAAGTEVCGGACVDTATDPGHCGSCGRSCAGGTCSAGACRCGDGGACDPGSTCVGGHCACAPGLVACASGCVEVSTSPDDCGSCGHACAAGEACISGNCTCAAGTVTCGGACVDTQTNPSHCGACPVSCADDERCAAGQCTCRPGLTKCNGKCVDLQNDADNCGACSTACVLNCVDGACQSVTCTSLGQKNCDRGCYTQAELDSDVLNCGDCGKQCHADEVCAGGSCRDYFTASGCAACPCAACGSGNTCCTYGGAAVCVKGSQCPM